MVHFQETLITWYVKNKRDLPWRHTKDPYKIWLSEVILQQTRVAQGKDYYLRFIEAFPTVNHLAKATEKKVLSLWQGLGYYSRARNLHATAKIITANHGGIFPDNYKELLLLKGIGPYTAAAIASFAFNKPRAVLDGNVFRVLSRLYNVSTPINSTQGLKEFQEISQSLINHLDPSTHNQAIMEFGALLCTPRVPRCNDCPFTIECGAYQNGTINQRPIKIKKNRVRSRYFVYKVFVQPTKGNCFSKEKNGKGHMAKPL